jgi:hypothetical protein
LGDLTCWLARKVLDSIAKAVPGRERKRRNNILFALLQTSDITLKGVLVSDYLQKGLQAE